MDATPSSTELVARFRAGDPDAAGQLFTHYARRLAGIADQHLSRQVAVRADAEDVVQSAFRTFFRRCARGEFHFDGSSGLWRLLVKITLLKARAKGRHHT